MVSTPASDMWRPERTTCAEAAWLGAAWGIAMHAILSFFALFMPELNAVLVLFVPAERFAFGIASGAPPFVRWVTLLVTLGIWWAAAAAGIVALVRELSAARRREAAPA